MIVQYRIRLSALVWLLAAGTVFAQSPRLPVNWKGLPEPYHTESASNAPRIVPRPAGAQLRVPEGFRVEEFASGFTKPRFMLVGSAGEILLSDSGERGSPSGAVYALKGGNKKTILQNLDRPYGMALYQDYLYVGQPTSIKRYKYKDMAISGEGEEVFSLEDFGKGHWTRSLLFDHQQAKLYVTIGSGSDHNKGDPPLRATINRINPDGGAHEVIARGLRNTVGLRLRPGTDELWATVQERDGLGDDLVPDFLIHVQQGGFYGWPDAYTGPHKEPRHEETNQEMVNKTLYPDVVLGAHVAVMDILFYDATQFPEKYKGGLFLAFRGSSNRARRVGYSITFIPFESGRPASGPTDFLTGWMMDPDKPEVWGRPVGLLQMSDGSMMISEDGAGTLWHVSYGSP